jgi:hypothetical protein
MMGGLQSIVQLGFAAIAIANFYTHLSAMGKKLVAMLKSLTGTILTFLNRRVTGKILGKLKNPETRMRTVKGVILNFVRVFSVVLLCLAAKLKSEIRRDAQDKLQKLEEEH